MASVRKQRSQQLQQNNSLDASGDQGEAAGATVAVPADGGAADATSLMDQFLHCPVCGNEYNAPKVLPCLHSFCFECLESSLTQSQIGPGQAFLCPICKTQCVVPPRGVRAMKSNVFLVTLQEFYHNKMLDDGQECEACDSGRAARKKCIECTDWLCNQCCSLHTKVKITKDHHLVSPQELASGKYDTVIKDSFEPLMCSRHNEPLKLYCTETTCEAPICTMCKTTQPHDGHTAIDLNEQAVRESEQLQTMLPNVQRFITAANDKLEILVKEDKMTSFVRKKMHKEINDRTQEVVDKLIQQIKDYAETLHSQVEDLAKEHRKDVARESEQLKNRVLAATSAKAYTDALLGFNRAEELVAMSREVRLRLGDFQKAPDPAPPAWRQPRLNPPAIDNDQDSLVKLFGTMTFEGEVVRSVLLKTFSARTQFDEKDCALCDVSLDNDGNIIVVDRDNRKVKIFDVNGNLKMSTTENEFKTPNRVAFLRQSSTILVKDEKYVRTLTLDGRVTGVFGDRDLKQPVGLAQSVAGEVLVTEWTGSTIVVFNEAGARLRSFATACEAAGYVAGSTNGNIVVSDWKQHVIKVFDRSGTFLRQFGQGQGTANGQLDHPYGVCCDRFDHIIVSDTWNNRILLLSADGKYISTLLGKDDGIEWPQAVVVDNHGRLIIVEQHGLVKIYQYMA